MDAMFLCAVFVLPAPAAGARTAAPVRAEARAAARSLAGRKPAGQRR